MMRHLLKFGFAVYFSLYAFFTSAQKEFARQVVDTLASPYMAGRGYVNDGCGKAARYILDQYKKLGLITFGSYSQEFHLPVNTYPKKIKVRVNGHLAKDGADYIAIPSTPSIHGTFPVLKFDRTVLTDSIKLNHFLKQDLSRSFIVVDDSGADSKKEMEILGSLRFNPFRAKGIIMLCDKLTEETSDTVMNYALLYAMRNTAFGKSTSIRLNIKNKFIKDYEDENIAGYVKGRVQPDSFIVFSAHYDHLGKMGDIYFPGANDNASGTAMLLSLARYYAKPENQPAFSIAFIAFGAEEADLRGSHYYVQHPLFPLSKIKFLINMDIMGTGDEGITVVNGSIYKAAFHDMVKINDTLHLLTQVKMRGPTANSDHYFFYAAGVPDFFIYTLGGINAYHDIYDRRETLPLTKFNEVFSLLVHFTDDLCRHRF